jgi:hypothetical protein
LFSEDEFHNIPAFLWEDFDAIFNYKEKSIVRKKTLKIRNTSKKTLPTEHFSSPIS